MNGFLITGEIIVSSVFSRICELPKQTGFSIVIHLYMDFFWVVVCKTYKILTCFFKKETVDQKLHQMFVQAAQES